MGISPSVRGNEMGPQLSRSPDELGKQSPATPSGVAGLCPDWTISGLMSCCDCGLMCGEWVAS